MPRYHFNTRIGDDWVADPDGTELPDADAAWETARDTILATLRDAKSRDATAPATLMAADLVVTDAAGETVLEFPFAEAVTPDPDRDASLH